MKTFRMRTMLLLAFLAVAAIMGLSRIARRSAAPPKRSAPAAGFSRKGMVYQRLDVAPATSTSYDLAADEAKGGHTLARHVGITDDELRERLSAEPDISAASSWRDRATAERIIDSALSQNREKLEHWRARAGQRPNLPLDYHGDIVIGRSLRRGETEVRDCLSALIVMKWDGAGGFVLTAYPVIGGAR